MYLEEKKQELGKPLVEKAEAKMIKSVDDFVDSLDVKEVKKALYDFYHSFINSQEREGGFHPDYLENTHFYHIMLLKLLDTLQDYRAFMFPQEFV